MTGGAALKKQPLLGLFYYGIPELMVLFQVTKIDGLDN